jgi:hypothetical protein
MDLYWRELDFFSKMDKDSCRYEVAKRLRGGEGGGDRSIFGNRFLVKDLPGEISFGEIRLKGVFRH